ncbi:hypothetical protein APX01_15870 [Cereibacter sphaeroides]|jgi:hypothetical protein|nr:hypothetical protein APX01_15870 [Cereibacter sphaeroides]ANS35767.1 hypothetical protein A3858_15890 [Cereibacter sphaeroides]ATN64820.1 hypothetical protein A3857_15885 [Cereibacter sphaeroides]
MPQRPLPGPGCDRNLSHVSPRAPASFCGLGTSVIAPSTFPIILSAEVRQTTDTALSLPLRPTGRTVGAADGNRVAPRGLMTGCASPAERRAGCRLARARRLWVGRARVQADPPAATG